MTDCNVPKQIVVDVMFTQASQGIALRAFDGFAFLSVTEGCLVGRRWASREVADTVTFSETSPGAVLCVGSIGSFLTS